MSKSNLLPLSLLLIAAGCSSGGEAGSGDGGGGAPPQGDTVTPGAFLAQDGLLVVEFESGDSGGSWAEETSLGGFTGSSYLTWSGANHYGDPGTDTFGFNFWIEDAGTYEFRIHNRHDHADSTLANDAWVRVDDGDWVKTFSWQRGQWTWATNHEFSHSNKPEASYALAQGNHRIEFSGRSADFSMDRFHLYDDGVVDPLSTSHPESSRSSSSLLAGGGDGNSPVDLGRVTAGTELSSLIQLDPSALGLDLVDEGASVLWQVAGAEFADGTGAGSFAPTVVLQGGVAAPVVLQVEGEEVRSVLQVEGAPAQVSGELRIGGTVELLFDERLRGSLFLWTEDGGEVDAAAVAVRSGSRVTFAPSAAGLWRYRGLSAASGEILEGAFRVLGAVD